MRGSQLGFPLLTPTIQAVQDSQKRNPNHLFTRRGDVWNTRHAGTKTNWSLFSRKTPLYRLSVYLPHAYRDPTVPTTQYNGLCHVTMGRTPGTMSSAPWPWARRWHASRMRPHSLRHSWSGSMCVVQGGRQGPLAVVGSSHRENGSLPGRK